MLPGKTIQLGVIDVGSEVVETPGKVAARLRAALEVLPVERLIAAPDCGCAALPSVATTRSKCVASPTAAWPLPVAQSHAVPQRGACAASAAKRAGGYRGRNVA